LLPTELYWMFGLIGVVCGMALLSALNFGVWVYLLKRCAHGFVPMVALAALLATALTLEETFLIYAASSPLILAVYVAAFGYIQRYYSSVLTVGVVTRRRAS